MKLLFNFYYRLPRWNLVLLPKRDSSISTMPVSFSSFYSDGNAPKRFLS